MLPAPVPIAQVRGPPPASPLSITPPTTPLSTPLPPPTPHILCDVCCEQVPLSSLRGCASCQHRYCAPCVDKYWTGAIYSGNHARLLCMYGGCGVYATDDDIRAVVSERTFRKMLYFRSRDRMHACPDARWCAVDRCWEYLGRFSGVGGMVDPVVECRRCHGRTCVKCERVVEGVRHVCASRKKNKAHSALFGLWATVHTKACPACAARIQRNHGCSHMTCTRCSSYFCWRCKGFLNNGCPLPGRACICDRVMTAAAYSGLAVVGVLGSPLIVTAALVGGVPYVVYRVVKARRERGKGRLGGVGEGGVLMERSVRAPGRVLQPDEMIGGDEEEEDFDSEGTRLTGFSEVVVEARGRRGVGAHAMAGEHAGVEEPSFTVEECRVGRPFILERRRGSVTGNRVTRRAVL